MYTKIIAESLENNRLITQVQLPAPRKQSAILKQINDGSFWVSLHPRELQPHDIQEMVSQHYSFQNFFFYTKLENCQWQVRNKDTVEDGVIVDEFPFIKKYYAQSIEWNEQGNSGQLLMIRNNDRNIFFFPAYGTLNDNWQGKVDPTHITKKWLYGFWVMTGALDTAALAVLDEFFDRASFLYARSYPDQFLDALGVVY